MWFMAGEEPSRQQLWRLRLATAHTYRKMRYELTRLVLEESSSVEITRLDFERAKRARRVILLALAIEERFNILLENYASVRSASSCRYEPWLGEVARVVDAMVPHPP